MRAQGLQPVRNSQMRHTVDEYLSENTPRVFDFWARPYILQNTTLLCIYT